MKQMLPLRIFIYYVCYDLISTLGSPILVEKSVEDESSIKFDSGWDSVEELLCRTECWTLELGWEPWSWVNFSLEGIRTQADYQQVQNKLVSMAEQDWAKPGKIVSVAHGLKVGQTLKPSSKYLKACTIVVLINPTGNFLEAIKQDTLVYLDYYVVLQSSERADVDEDVCTFLADFKYAWTFPLNEPKSRHLSLRPRLTVPDRGNRISLNGRHVRLAGITVPPLIVLDPAKKAEVTGGTFHAFFDTAARFYNFTYHLNTEYFRQRGPGKRDPVSGKWSGVIGAITRRECELTFMGHQAARYDFMHFSTPLFFDESIFVAALPQVSIRWQALFGPFQPFVWLALLVATTGISIAMYVIMRCQGITRGEVEQHMIYRSWSLPVTALLEQDSIVPESVTPLAVLWMFVTIILGTVYKDQLVSYLTFPELEFVPKNFHDLSKHGDYNIIVDGLLISFRLNNSQNAAITKLMERFKVERNTEHCVSSAALEKKVVCLGYKPMLSVAIASNLTINYKFSPTVESSDLLPHVHVSVAIRKSIGMISDWERIAGWYRDAGMYENSKKLVIEHFKRIGKSQLEQQRNGDAYGKLMRIMQSVISTISPLKINHFYGIFGIWGGMIVLAAFVFCGEVIGGLAKEIPRQRLFHKVRIIWFDG